jgi:hypothetical protein
MNDKISLNIEDAIINALIVNGYANYLGLQQPEHLMSWEGIFEAFQKKTITKDQLGIIFYQAYASFVDYYKKHPVGEKIISEYVSGGEVYKNEATSEYPDFDTIFSQFRLFFPIDGRLPGVVYFDSLFEDWCNERGFLTAENQSIQETDNINIPLLWKFERTKEYIIKCYHSCFIKRGKKKPMFYLHPIKDVFVFDRMYRVFEYTEKKGLFDKDVNFEAATNEYCNGFKDGYKEFTDKVSKDSRYNESLTFETATQFFSPVSWYPHTYKDGKIIPQNWDVLGKIIGKFYAAWCIVLEQQNNFEPLFTEFYKQQEKQAPPINKDKHDSESNSQWAYGTDKIKDIPIQNLHTFLTDGKVIECDLIHFATAIRMANFTDITPKIKSKFQYMIYLLSTNVNLGDEWYSAATESIKVKKEKCSGATLNYATPKS